MNKTGMTSLWLAILGIAMILFFTMIYILYFQVGVIKNSIKEELYYALMNGQISLDKEELSLSNYTVNKNKLQEVLEIWAKETASKKVNVTNIKIDKLLTNTTSNKAALKIELLVTFVPIVKIDDKVAVRISEEVDISLLKLK